MAIVEHLLNFFEDVLKEIKKVSEELETANSLFSKTKQLRQLLKQLSWQNRAGTLWMRRDCIAGLALHPSLNT